MSNRWYFGGAPFLPGTNLPSNVTGECGHRHRSPEAAQRCIDAEDQAIKRGHGANAYCDRVVMVHVDDPDAEDFGTRPYEGEDDHVQLWTTADGAVMVSDPIDGDHPYQGTRQ